MDIPMCHPHAGQKVVKKSEMVSKMFCIVGSIFLAIWPGGKIKPIVAKVGGLQS